MSIADIVGQTGLVSTIEAALNDVNIKTLRLTGSPGTGKSTIALRVGHDWEAAGGALIVAPGDDQQGGRAYSPFLLGLRDVPTSWKKVAIEGSRSALKVLDALEGTGGFASGIFDLLGVAVKQRSERSLRSLNPMEREIVGDLRRQTKGRRTLIIADNFHWWDKSSIELLEQLQSSYLSTSIPELAGLKVLLVDTEGEQRALDPATFTRVCKSANANFSTTLCDRTQYGALLSAFGVTQILPESLAYSLYALTGGHLKITQQLAAYLTDREASLINTDVGGPDRLISMRLATLGAESTTLEICLRMASLIGLAFDSQELACATNIPLSTLKSLLARAESLHFLDSTAERPRFSHDVLRAFFLRTQSSDALCEARRVLQECIGKLRPGDYDLRSKLLLDCGEQSKARDLLALAAAQRLREGNDSLRALELAQETFPNDPSLIEWVQVLATGYRAIATGNHGFGFTAVSSGPFDSESLIMAAERSYVAAICAMELQTQDGFDDSRRLLETWVPRVGHELELSFRMRLLLQQVHVLAGNLDQARAIEAVLEADLLDRATYDPGAVELLQVQNRRAASVHAPEIAARRIERATRYYSTDNGTARRVIGCYKALSNLAAIQIQLGRYEEAYTTAQRAESLILNERNVDFPRKDVFSHNLVLAAVRSGNLDFAKAAAYQQRIVASPEGKGDNFLQRCNLAAYYLLGNDVQAAEYLLDELSVESEQRRFTETYLLYYVETLRMAMFLLGKNIIQAQRLQEKLGPLVAALKWTTAPYLRRRYDLWRAILNNADTDLDRPGLDRLVTTTHPTEVGPCWDHNSRLVPCVELAFWSDA